MIWLAPCPIKTRSRKLLSHWEGKVCAAGSSGKCVLDAVPTEPSWRKGFWGGLNRRVASADGGRMLSRQAVELGEEVHRAWRQHHLQDISDPKPRHLDSVLASQKAFKTGVALIRLQVMKPSLQEAWRKASGGKERPEQRGETTQHENTVSRGSLDLELFRKESK